VGPEMLSALLDSLIDPFIFVDLDHVVRYMNKAAKEEHKGSARIGQSLFDCHSDASKEKILACAHRLSAGENDILIADNADGRIFMRAVRDENGELLGYYERYETLRHDEQRRC